MPADPLPIVVLISGSGTNLQAIIDSIECGQLNADIKAVISNRPGVKGLERAEKAGVEAKVLDHKNYETREEFDQSLSQLIESYSPKLVILAGFMRILSEDFVNHYEGRMLNIHPSLLPKFRGLNTHQRVIDAKRKEHGASIHFVTNELDSGPLVIQAVITVNENDNTDSLAKRIHEQEHVIYPMAISWFAEGKLTYDNKKTYLDGKIINQPPQWINDQLEGQPI